MTASGEPPFFNFLKLAVPKFKHRTLSIRSPRRTGANYHFLLEHPLHTNRLFTQLPQWQIKLLRFISWYRRFFDFLKNKSKVKSSFVSLNELNAAKHRWISYEQKQSFEKNHYFDWSQEKHNQKSAIKTSTSFTKGHYAFQKQATMKNARSFFRKKVTWAIQSSIIIMNSHCYLISLKKKTIQDFER